MAVKRPKPIVLTVLDGWGFRADTKGNAIALARKPNYDRLLAEVPNTLIHTSGQAVGLPEGQMGNSEVGHMNMGAGRVVQMDITRVDQAIASGALFYNDLLLSAMQRGREQQLHLIGLLSDGGVHSHIDHLSALLRMARENKVERVFVHCFLDGRDTPPHSGIDFVRQLQQKLRELGVGRIASLTGRYYAMDRDNRWERVERAYRAVVHGEAETRTADPVEALRRSYEQGVTDEFVLPVVVNDGRQSLGSAGCYGARRRCRDLLQLPRRPRTPVDPRDCRAGLRQICRSRAAEGPNVRGHDAVRQELLVAALLVRPGKTRAHSGAGFRVRRLSATCASRKPKSTRMSPTSLTVGSGKAISGRGACTGALA